MDNFSLIQAYSSCFVCEFFKSCAIHLQTSVQDTRKIQHEQLLLAQALWPQATAISSGRVHRDTLVRDIGTMTSDPHSDMSTFSPSAAQTAASQHSRLQKIGFFKLTIHFFWPSPPDIFYGYTKREGRTGKRERGRWSEIDREREGKGWMLSHLAL